MHSFGIQDKLNFPSITLQHWQGAYLLNFYLESCPSVSATTPDVAPHPIARAELSNTEELSLI